MSNSYWRERLILDAVDRRIFAETERLGWPGFDYHQSRFPRLAAFCILGLLLSLAVTLAVPVF